MTDSPKAAGKGKPDKKKITHHLPVKLTPEEINKVAKKLADHLDEIEQLELEAKKLAKDMKDTIGGHQADVRVLRKVLQAGAEERDVKCEEIYNWNKGVVNTFRLDLNEEVTSVSPRKISGVERQTHLPDGAEKKT